MENIYKHTDRGLALYLGADCEYFKVAGGTHHVVPVCGLVIQKVQLRYSYTDFVLHLRPPDSITPDETQWLEARVNNLKARYGKGWNLRYGSMAAIADDIRSLRIDVGGPCLKDGHEELVESFIDVGLAKEVKL